MVGKYKYIRNTDAVHEIYGVELVQIFVKCVTAREKIMIIFWTMGKPETEHQHQHLQHSYSRTMCVTCISCHSLFFLRWPALYSHCRIYVHTLTTSNTTCSIYSTMAEHNGITDGKWLCIFAKKSAKIKARTDNRVKKERKKETSTERNWQWVGNRLCRAARELSHYALQCHFVRFLAQRVMFWIGCGYAIAAVCERKWTNEWASERVSICICGDIVFNMLFHTV